LNQLDSTSKCNSSIRFAPAERNVPDIGRKTNLCFAPLEREESLAVARSINISPRWGEVNTAPVAPPNWTRAISSTHPLL